MHRLSRTDADIDELLERADTLADGAGQRTYAEGVANGIRWLIGERDYPLRPLDGAPPHWASKDAQLLAPTFIPAPQLSEPLQAVAGRLRAGIFTPMSEEEDEAFSELEARLAGQGVPIIEPDGARRIPLEELVDRAA